MTEKAAYLRDASVICCVHTILSDNEESLFLRERAGRLLVINHPMIEAKQYDKNLDSTTAEYRAGELKKVSRFKSPPGPEPLIWLKDAAATFWFAGRARGRFDIFIGTDVYTAFLGLILRRLGKVTRVIYAPTDYMPERFSNKTINRVYHVLERRCCYGADCIWDVSPATIERRYIAGVDRKRCAPVFVVPNGNYFDDIRRRPIEEVNRYSLAYIGALDTSKGVEMIIEALPVILEKVPEANLVIIGGGAGEPELKSLAAKLGVEKRIQFTGFTSKREIIEKSLTESAIGLAPYALDPDGYIKYGDPLKVKQYLACGLPVVLTDAPAVAEEVSARKAGISVGADVPSIADAVIRLLTDDDLYRKTRKNAIAMWGRITLGPEFLNALFWNLSRF